MDINNDDKVYLIKTVDFVSEDNKKVFFDFMNNDAEKQHDEDYYLINLFSIIVDDYQNYPNFNHIETISN